VGDRSGRSFQLGDQFEVVLLDVQAPQGKLDLVPADNHKNKKRDRKEKSKRSKTKKSRKGR